MPSLTASAKVVDPASASCPDAATVYRGRIVTLRGQERRLQRKHIQFGYLRLALGIVLVFFLLPPRWYAWLAFAGFGIAARMHQGVLRRLAETRRALAFHEHNLARLEDRWAGLRPRTTPLPAEGSLFANDLDLFGPGSLFELLSEAHTSLGEQTLAAWLLRPGTPAEVRRRQQAVADLRSHWQLREAFAAAPGPALASVPQEELAAWSQAPPVALPTVLTWIAPVLVLAILLGVWRYAVAHTPLLLALVLLVEISLTFHYRKAFQNLFSQAEKSGRALRTVTALLALLEREPLQAESLTEAQEALRTPGQASEALASLTSLTNWAEARSNYVVRILDAPFLYSLQLGLALERWRRRYGTYLTRWLTVLGEVEALLSLAGYSFEHPDDCIPEIAEQGPVFSAQGLGHPLLPATHCVRNDVSLGTQTQLLLVSGSNMSGKSTLLRSVGINAVLALAGAPVRARSLALSPMHLAASIQVSDSLQSGRSRFYAEILRLRAITEAAHTGPVLFLIDEVLAGTNSSDRLAGAQGLVQELLATGALGMLSTHDLALTAVAGENTSIRNVHFEDQVEDGQLRFDYHLRDGVVERSNGLALMRLIGLRV